MTPSYILNESGRHVRPFFCAKKPASGAGELIFLFEKRIENDHRADDIECGKSHQAKEIKFQMIQTVAGVFIGLRKGHGSEDEVKGEGH